MRRLFLAAFAACSFAFLCSFANAASPLQPFQQKALDAILAAADPRAHAALRAQFEPMLAGMNQAQVDMIVAQLAANQAEKAAQEEAEAEAPRFDENYVATPEDLEFNRSQYEPAIRDSWQAQKAFDDFATAQLASDCGPEGKFAVFGSGWRYEVYPLNPTWTRASDSANLDVQVIGQSYAPQDGRYQFDFSEVRTTFDQAAVKAGIASACAEYAQIGQAFMAEAKGRSEDDLMASGYDLEGKANGQVESIRQKLESLLKQHAPATNGALYTALLNGQRIK